MSADAWVALGLAVLALACFIPGWLRNADAELQAHIDDALALVDEDRRQDEAAFFAWAERQVSS